MTVRSVINTALEFYSLTIFVYVMLSWFRGMDWAMRLHDMLAPVCEPYIGLFRRIVPPMGMIDFSPLVALLVLEFLIRGMLVPVLLGLAGL